MSVRFSAARLVWAWFEQVLTHGVAVTAHEWESGPLVVHRVEAAGQVAWAA